MKAFFSTVILLTISFVSSTAIANQVPLTNEQIDAQMKQMASNINKQLPRKVDDIITLEKIDYSDKVFSYFYKIDELNKLQNLSSIESDTNRTICKTMIKIITQGFSYHYNYVAPNNERLLDFIINKESCDQVK